MKNTFIWFLLIAIVGFISCKRSEWIKEPSNRYPNILIVLPNAMKVTNSKYNDTFESYELSYELNVKFPAAEIIDEVSKRLKDQGLEPSKYDFINPGKESSQSMGWTHFGRKSGRDQGSDQNVFQWIAEWQDKDKNIIWYAFIYTEPLNKQNIETLAPNTEIMRVIAKLIPAKTAQEMLKRISQTKAPNVK